MRQKSATESGSEAKLVGLAALHQFDATLLDNGATKNSDSIKNFLSNLAEQNPAAIKAISIMLDRLEKEIMKKAPVEFEWPPTDEEIQNFKLWSAGITVR